MIIDANTIVAFAFFACLLGIYKFCWPRFSNFLEEKRLEVCNKIDSSELELAKNLKEKEEASGKKKHLQEQVSSSLAMLFEDRDNLINIEKAKWKEKFEETIDKHTEINNKIRHEKLKELAMVSLEAAIGEIEQMLLHSNEAVHHVIIDKILEEID